jgi:hypothetical protein
MNCFSRRIEVLRMSFPRLSLLLAGLACGWPALLAGAEVDIAADTPWAQSAFTRLDVDFPGGEFHARWDIHRCACGDILVQAEETLPEGPSTGELLLVGGRVLLARGFANMDPGAALLDSPMLMLQLLLVLVQQAEPAGPAAISAEREVDLAEEREPLRLDTGTAHGGFPAPWRLGGMLRPAEAGSRRFDLSFEFASGMVRRAAPDASMRLAGVMDFGDRAFPYDGKMRLKGWKVFMLDPDDAARIEGQPAGNLADLRALVQALP